MKRQVIMLILLCVISLMARGQNANTSGDVQCDTLKKTEQRQRCQRTPVNDYSGLNSLRARLANRFWDGQSDTTKFHDTVDERIVHVDGHDETSETLSSKAQERRGMDSTGNRYFDDILSPGIPIGAPLLVFFKGGGTELMNPSQLINVRQVAELAKCYGFKVKITGCADAATGSAEINQKISQARAEYIKTVVQEVCNHQVEIITFAEGGINMFTPSAANRQCKIELYIQTTIYDSSTY